MRGSLTAQSRALEKSLRIRSTISPIAFRVAGASNQPEGNSRRSYQSRPNSESNRSWIRSEEHTSELQSLMRISYAVFCLKKKNKNKHTMRTNKLQIDTE